MVVALIRGVKITPTTAKLTAMQAAVAAQAFQYRPRLLDEIECNDVSLINEPMAPENVIPLPMAHSLHAVLCEALTNTQALLTRLEAGVTVRGSNSARLSDCFMWRHGIRRGR